MTMTKAEHDRCHAKRRFEKNEEKKKAETRRRPRATPPRPANAQRARTTAEHSCPENEKPPAERATSKAKPSARLAPEVGSSSQGRGGGLKLCCPCGKDFAMSDAAVRFYQKKTLTKKRWEMKNCCFRCTNAKKSAAAEAARAAAAAARAAAVAAKQRQQQRPGGKPEPRAAIEGGTQQAAGASAQAGEDGTTRPRAEAIAAAVEDDGASLRGPGFHQRVNNRRDSGFLAQREQVMDDLIDLAKHLAWDMPDDVFSVATRVSFEERGLSCTSSAEGVMAGRRTLWEAVCSKREWLAEHIFDGFGLAFEHVDHGDFPGVFSLSELPEGR